MEQYRGTTICSVRRGNQVVMGGDGQVTLGNTVMKSNARKVRRMYKDQVIAGFAGATADAFTLFERFEGKLDKYFQRYNAARIALGECCNMAYFKEVPFSEETAGMVSTLLGDLDEMFHRLHGEATDWLDEQEQVKPG